MGQFQTITTHLSGSLLSAGSHVKANGAQIIIVADAGYRHFATLGGGGRRCGASTVLCAPCIGLAWGTAALYGLPSDNPIRQGPETQIWVSIYPSNLKKVTGDIAGKEGV